MANRTVKVVLEASVSGLTNGFRTAGKSVKDFDKQFSDAVKNKPQELATVTQAIGGLGVAFTALSGIAVKKAADFEQAMSNVRAATHASAGEMGVLSEAALEAGASTVFSASEAAGAIEELAKAGLTTSQILSGGLSGSLDLAAAGGLDVAKAAEITSNALNQFGLNGNQASHVADLLAAGAGKASGDVDDLGMALNQAGLVANQTGLSIEETTGALASFASQGLLGSDAGTSLKTMLQRLTPQSKAAASQFEELGISAYDASGNFVGLSDFAGQLRTSMSTLSPEARNAAMSVMFGSDAVRAATVLYNQGADGIQEWIDKVDDQGYAAETARLRLDNLKGDVEALGGALDTAFIKSGDGATQALRGVVQAATSVVDKFGELPDGVQSGLGTLTGATGIAALAVAGLAGVATKIHEAKAAFNGLGISARTAGAAMGVAGAAIGAATIILGDWATELAKNNALAEEVYGTLDKVSGAHTKATREAIANSNATRQYNEFLGLGGKTANEFAHSVGVSVDALTDASMGSEKAIKSLQALEAAQKKADPSYNYVAWEFLWKAIGDGQDAMDASGQKFEDMQAAMEGTEDSADSTAGAVESLTVAYESNAEAVQEAYDQTMAYINGALSAERAAMAYEEAIDAVSDAVDKNGKTLDIGTEKGRANRSALLDIADAGLQQIESLKSMNASEEELQAAMAETRKDFIKAYRQFDDNKKAAKAYADQLGLFPSDIKTTATLTATTDPANSIINGFIAQQERKIIRLRVAADPTTTIAHSSTTVMRAGGGSVFGPGTETSDSIPALLSNNEHVWSAAEVRGAGGHGVLARMRGLAKAGLLPAFATGGAVGSKSTELEVARADVGSWKSYLKEAEAAEKRAQKKYDSIDGTKENRAAKKRAKAELAKAKAETKRTEKKLKKAEEYRDGLKDEIADLKASKASLTAGVGEKSFTYNEKTGKVETSNSLMDQGTSGLSGAYGLVEQAKAEANLDGLSSKQSSKLKKAAAAAKKEFEKLYKEAARLEGELAKAESHVSEMASVKNGIASNLAGGFSLGDSIKPGTEDTTETVQKSDGKGNIWHETVTTKGTKASVKGSDLVASAKQYAGKLKNLGNALKRLAGKGLSSVVLQEIAGYGPDDGLMIANSISDAQIKELNGAYADIERYSQAAGYNATLNYTTEDGTFIAGGLAAGEATVATLEKQIASNEAAIAYQTDKLLDAMGSPFEVKYDKASGKMVSIAQKKADGGFVYGAGTATSDSIPALLSNGEFVVRASQAQKPSNAALLTAMNAGKAVSAAPAYRPVINVNVPDVYVQNPWTGDYMKAQMAGVADKQIKVAIGAAARGY